MSTAPFTRTYATRRNGSSWSVVPTPNPDSTQNLLVDPDGSDPDPAAYQPSTSMNDLSAAERNRSLPWFAG